MKKNDLKTKAPVVSKEISEKLFERIFLPWTTVLILSHLLTIYVAPAYMWGVHFYHFFPAYLGWILTLVTLTILIPGIGELLYERVEALAKKIKKPFASLGQNKTFVILSLFSLPIFWIFRTRLHLLGDGYFRIRDLEQGRIHLQEWLDGLVHLMVYRVMIKFIPTWTPELTYLIISILCGGVFVFLALKLSSLLGKTGFGKVLIFFFLVSSGSIQLFFGYVESYSILQVMLLAYIFFAVLYLSGKTSILPALLVFVISVGLHIASLMFALSFIYLLLGSHKRIGEKKASFRLKDGSAPQGSTEKRKVHLRKECSQAKSFVNIPTSIALILSSVAIIFWVHKVATGLEKTGKGIFILPLKVTEDFSYSMFSLAHISEFINQLLLVSPLSISLIIFFIFFKIKFRSTRSSQEFENRLNNFLAFATLLGLIYLFVFNFTLGSADWDLRSFPAPFIGLLGVLLFLRWGEERSTDSGHSVEDPPGSEKTRLIGSLVGKRFTAWGLIFMWFGLFHTLPWVLINAHHQRSLDRYLLIQENDPHPVDETNYNLYKIARILRLAGWHEEVPKMYQRATERDPYDTLSYFNLAAHYHRNQNFDQTILILDTLLKIDPVYPKANWMIGNIYYKREDYAKALPYMEKASRFLADNSNFLYQLGLVYYSTNQPEKAIACARQMIKLGPEYLEAFHLLGMSFASLSDFENARQAWEYILGVDPYDSVAVRNLKEIEKHLKK
ncbi:MAG: tetratricopeptide repeat protein [candidate division Zixibacteria bacterium]|nr:tetratricopeptide repeat protein [candidate division Zixibacteria bacterium]